MIEVRENVPNHFRIESMRRDPDRLAGRLVCQCVAGPVNADGGCPTCHRLVLTVADDRPRIDALRARTVR